uniref:Cation channel sperm-associated protein subunit beta n=1 Tax=Callorhinchus milii TaxID=7868 RepID=A0A4W3IUT8_CALMI|eukprot:gi/632979873/ref/XP_007906716.1/ PREDICTED: cation channel sperm-associated protein subunit beta [Callorhinchus milii]
MTEGTLLDIAREPLLQWNIGTEAQTFFFSEDLQLLQSILITRSPCANDVVILLPIFNSTTLRSSDINLIVTKTSFTSNEEKWINIRPTLCALLIEGCTGINVLNLKLTNYHLIIQTTHGFFISQDLRSVNNTGDQLKFEIMHLNLPQINHRLLLLSYNEQCLTTETNFSGDFLSIIEKENALTGKINSCIYIMIPITEWHLCLSDLALRDYGQTNTIIIAVVWDKQRSTKITLAYQHKRAVVYVYRMENFLGSNKKIFPEFYFELDFLPEGMFVHPSNHVIYVYGSQVWFSKDGGNYFQLILSLRQENVVRSIICLRNHVVIFVTNKGNAFYTSPGLTRYVSLGKLEKKRSVLHCDHLGTLLRITFDPPLNNNLKVETIDLDALLEADDTGFDSILALQFLTDKQAVFHEFTTLKPLAFNVHVRHFSEFHVGKSLKMRAGGLGEIVAVYEKHNIPGFISAAVVNIIEHYNADPFTAKVLSNILVVENKVNGTIFLRLEPGDVGFEASDVEKTVVVPGISSFLIIEVLSPKRVKVKATNKDVLGDRRIFDKGMWILYDFGIKNGRRWRIIENKCTTRIQDINGIEMIPLKHLDHNDTVSITFKAFSSKLDTWVFQLSVGNPIQVNIRNEQYWIDSGTIVLNIRATSLFYKKGYSTLLVYIPGASLRCFLTSFTIILVCSCPPGKYIIHRLPISINREYWLNCNRPPFTTCKALKTLPANYRPPSKYGISIPLSENIYNADPQQPRMRDFYKISKESGHYKQCALKMSREECGCTDEMKLSSYAIYSDCRERVFSILYPVHNLSISLYMKRPGMNDIPLGVPYFITITEVNNRTNWKIIGNNIDPSLKKLRKYFSLTLSSIPYSAQGLFLKLLGSELYHFRVTVIPGVSFCELVEEFQIYVEDPPMAFPFQTLISMITAMLLGAVLIIYFFIHRSYNNSSHPTNWIDSNVRRLIKRFSKLKRKT